jgi:hypothetical protein
LVDKIGNHPNVTIDDPRPGFPIRQRARLFAERKLLNIERPEESQENESLGAWSRPRRPKS